ncbi:DUF2959 domain-containing protein [Glaciecola siphonariae]|uniref:DUF2959 domain-containing protein n=1 Tax=Glaciecola siphonariae TaxID=521012 RepID=A0ABV9LY10_9ALTE
MVHKIFLAAGAIVLMAGCQSAIDDAYFSMWDKIGVEKRDILVDRVEDAQDSQKEAQEEFADALEEFSALINFDGGELQDVYEELKDEYEDSKESAEEVSDRINKVEAVAESLFREWEEELGEITNANLRRDSSSKLRTTRRNYEALIRSMRKVEASMAPVLASLQDNVLYLKHNLNANAISSLQGELSTIKTDVDALIKEMNDAIKQSDDFIATIKS